MAMHYADLLANNHLAIDDALYAQLAQHFTDKAVVELGIWCAICVGFGRLTATWNIVEDLPHRFQSDGLAPAWGPDAWVSTRSVQPAGMPDSSRGVASTGACLRLAAPNG